MKYFATISSEPGGNSLPYNPCQLLDFQLVNLGRGQTLTGESLNREVLAIILGGKASFEIGNHWFENIGARANVFSGKPHSVYISANSPYKLIGESNVQIALVSAPAELQTNPYVIPPDQVATGIWGAANFTRRYHQILHQDTQPTCPAQRLIVGETFTPSGNWSTYPAHKHEEDNGQEAYHEEMYFFKISPAEGFGITRFYTDKDGGIEENFTVRDNTILMLPYGYHTYVGAPGYSSYYLWVLAGNHRVQGVTVDPDTAWINKTVPMLRELGH